MKGTNKRSIVGAFAHYGRGAAMRLGTFWRGCAVARIAILALVTMAPLHALAKEDALAKESIGT